MGTLAAPMARVAKSVTAHSQRFSPMRAMRSPFLRAPAEQGLAESTHALVDLVRGDGLPAAEIVLPQDGAGIARGGDAAE